MTRVRVHVLQPDIIKKLGDPAFNISMENHEFGVPPENFDKWPVLKDTFTIISTTKDRSALLSDTHAVSLSCDSWTTFTITSTTKDYWVP